MDRINTIFEIAEYIEKNVADAKDIERVVRELRKKLEHTVKEKE